MNVDVEYLIDKLMDYYQVSSNYELADKLKMKASSVSSWKTKKSVNAIKKKTRELGIYAEIFGDTQQISSNHGQIAQNVSGNQSFNNTQKRDNIDSATYALFEEIYNRAVEADDLKGLRIHLMEY